MAAFGSELPPVPATGRAQLNELLAKRRQFMKQIASLTAIAALMLGLGAVNVYAQHLPLTFSFSGTEESSTLNLQAGAVASEWNMAGSGTLGRFNYHGVEASDVPPGACPGMNHPYAGAGVFRFEDGSLMMVSLTQGSDCLQFTSTGPVAHCTRTFQITGGTGRLKNVSAGTIAVTGTVLAVLFDASSKPVLFANTGQMTGMVSEVASAAEPRGNQQ
jgi:hypothetical protein